MLTEVQKETAQGIIQIFETGKINSKKAYSTVTLLKGDTGGLTYGKHQTTINSGNLYLMLKAYVEDSGADFAKEMSAYLPRLASKSSSLGSDTAFKDLLRKAGQDQDMQEVQNAFFDRVYWVPSVAECTRLGMSKALAVAIVYDSFIHGSWRMIRDRTNAKVGTANNAGEITWARAYNDARRAWLANHSNTLLRKTVYRQDAFNLLLKGSNWDLNLPITVRGSKITAEVLGITTEEIVPTDDVVVDVTPEDANDRLLWYVKDGARMQGKDVEELQTALAKLGFYSGKIDGDFGSGTDKAVEAYQRKQGVRVDGIVGNATRSKLGL